MVSEPFNTKGVHLDRDEQARLMLARMIAQVLGPQDDAQFETLEVLPYVIWPVMKDAELQFSDENANRLLAIINPAVTLLPEDALKTSLVRHLRDMKSVLGENSFAVLESRTLPRYSDPSLSDDDVIALVRADFEAVIDYQIDQTQQLLTANTAPLMDDKMRQRVLNFHMDNLVERIEEQSRRIPDHKPVDEEDLLRRMKAYDRAVREAGLRDGSLDPKLP